MNEQEEKAYADKKANPDITSPSKEDRLSKKNVCKDCLYYKRCNEPERQIKCMGFVLA